MTLSHKQRRLVTRYLPLVRPVALALTRRFDGLDYDDAYSDGCLGLIAACQRFEISLRDTFPHFAKQRIRGAIIDGLRQRCLRYRSARWVGMPAIEIPLHRFERLSETDTLPGEFVVDPISHELLLRSELRHYLNTLTARERFILWAIYEAEWNYIRIGRHLGISKHMVGALHEKLIKRLRERFGADALLISRRHHLG